MMQTIVRPQRFSDGTGVVRGERVAYEVRAVGFNLGPGVDASRP